ncbi:MAG TPA: MarR family transcriptional regulator [Burkholderiaceae bacterium]|nr:MarR family transcriptional regulator [Burkholderiaceae bacterium]
MSSTPGQAGTDDGPLTPVTERFVVHWGEMGSRWGVNRTVAQIHALLFIHGRPMHADEIVQCLGVARSNVSTSLRELQNYNLVRIVHLLGDRRDHFETSGDVWELLRTVVRERKAREFEPTIAVLRECLAHPEIARESATARQRINETLVLMDTVSTWVDEMLRLPHETLMKILKLGAKIQSLLSKVRR